MPIWYIFPVLVSSGIPGLGTSSQNQNIVIRQIIRMSNVVVSRSGHSSQSCDCVRGASNRLEFIHVIFINKIKRLFVAL
jgi:hypothetical protein